MRTETRDQARIDQLDRGEWLYRLLDDVRQEVTEQPKRAAIKRIRARLLVEMQRPERAAA